MKKQKREQEEKERQARLDAAKTAKDEAARQQPQDQQVIIACLTWNRSIISSVSGDDDNK
jgi:hypothetical protein